MLNDQKHFTIPKIAKGKSKFVFFRYFNVATNKWDLFVKKGGANNKNLKASERNSLLTNLRDALEYKLATQGWDPITDTYPQMTAEELQIEQLRNMRFEQALGFSLSKMKVASKTRLDYNGTIRYFTTAAKDLRLPDKYITDFERVYIKLLISRCRENRNWSNIAVNKNLGYLKSMLSNLIEWEVIKYNPAMNIKSLPIMESNKCEPLTEKEKKTLREFLFIHHYRFFVITLLLYQTGIRPKEILALKISECNLINKEIKIVPMEDLENSKNKKVRKVPLNKHIVGFLRELRLSDYNPDYYIFGSPYTAGGNKGSAGKGLSGALHPDYFKPSSTRIKRDTVTKFWKKIVIDGLGIKKQLYPLKHTGANDKILAGIDLDALRELYGHSSTLMTEKYAKVVKEVYRKQIIDLSREF